MDKVLDFWFKELAPEDWFKKDPAIDERIASLFKETFYKATRGELFQWRGTIHGRLAEIIVLDQFSRNIFRDDPRAFEFDYLALALSQEASLQPETKSLTNFERAFLYMPHMHSESVLIHKHAVELFSQTGLEKNLEFELKHKVIIDRFGRYPHRNAILGRESSNEELEFLKQDDSSF